MPLLRSPRAIWRGLYALHLAALAGGTAILAYSVFPLRLEKVEAINRIEGVPFMAMPPAVPPDQWERMTAVDHEIVEPLADWIRWTSGAVVTVSGMSLVLLLRLWPCVDRGIAVAATEPAAASD